jgi:hypothetical protein
VLLEAHHHLVVLLGGHQHWVGQVLQIKVELPVLLVLSRVVHHHRLIK